MSTIAKCKCSNVAVWWYTPGTDMYCEDCVHRGCSCNINPETGKEDTDELGRLLPCCEYMYRAEGWENEEDIP